MVTVSLHDFTASNFLKQCVYMFILFRGGDAPFTSVKYEKLKTVDLAIHDIKGLFEQWQTLSHKSLSRKNSPAQTNDMLGYLSLLFNSIKLFI